MEKHIITRIIHEIPIKRRKTVSIQRYRQNNTITQKVKKVEKGLQIWYNVITTKQ